jgi:glycosyltransferase involved in cell wall biosynthesis
MRICHISTFWPNRLGLTHYTHDLLMGIAAHHDQPQLVVGEGATDPGETDEWVCKPFWSRAGDYIPDVVRGVKEMGADVAYLQYANDVFGDDERFPALLAALKRAGVGTIVNMHSVYDPYQRSGFKPGGRIIDFDRAIAAHATRIHLHTDIMKRDLIGHGVDPEQIAVIPHGTAEMQDPGVAPSRDRLGLPRDAKVVLFFGFVWLGKGIDFLISVMNRVMKSVPEAHLYLGGYTRHKRFYGEAYMAWLQGRIRLHGMQERTMFYGDYVPDELVPVMFSAADVVAFPYKQRYSSVSGVAHQCAAMGRAPVCSRIAKFDEVGQHVSPDLLVGQDDVAGWARVIERLLTDDDYAADIRARASRFAADTAWDVVGGQHLALCREVMAARGP